MSFEGMFNGLITLIAGSTALLIYFLQKGRDKKNAARAILSEIQNAEIAIEQIQATKVVSGITSVIRTDYWAQYSHLLLNEFDFLEQRTITQFYNGCKLIQQRVEQLQQQESDQRREAGFELQRKIVDLCLNEDDVDKLKNKIEKMTSTFHGQSYWFDQNAVKASLLDALNNVKNITNTPIGEKLKQAAGL